MQPTAEPRRWAAVGAASALYFFRLYTCLCFSPCSEPAPVFHSLQLCYLSMQHTVTPSADTKQGRSKLSRRCCRKPLCRALPQPPSDMHMFLPHTCSSMQCLKRGCFGMRHAAMHACKAMQGPSGRLRPGG